MRDLAAALLLTALAGCVSPDPYQPSRAIVRSIPHEQAKAALRDLLSHGTNGTKPLTAVEVGDDAFAYRVDATPHRYRYAEIAPHAYRVRGGGWKLISITGEFERRGWGADKYPHIYFDREEDLERCLDALESLKADALARAGKGGTP